MESYCDRALAEVLNLLRIQIVVGIGRFAEKKAQNVVKQFMIPHTQVIGKKKKKLFILISVEPFSFYLMFVR